MKHPNYETPRGDLLDWAGYWLTRFAPIYTEVPKSGEEPDLETMRVRWPTP